MTNKLQNEALKSRKSEHSIHPLILGRWSPRAMTGESISDETVMALFEAARWAPSCYNEQPWRFIYAKKGTPAWDTIFALMVPFNQQWAKNAALLGVVISHKVFARNGKPIETHSFDTGAAWMLLSLEGCARGLVVHGMQGFDYKKAKNDLHVPDDYQVEAMFAVGVQASKDTLPKEMQEGETPSSRNPVSTFAFEGTFRA